MIDFIIAVIEVYIHKEAGQRLHEIYCQYRGWWILLLVIAGLMALFYISMPFLDQLILSFKQINSTLI